MRAAALPLLVFLVASASAGGSANVPPGPGATTDLPEGRLVALAPGNYSWSLAPGEYLFALAADEGGLAYESNASRPEVAPAPTTCVPVPRTPGDAGRALACMGEPRLTGGSVSSLRIRPGDALALRVTNGSGRALVARADLYDSSLFVETADGVGAFLEADANATCTAYGVQEGPFHLATTTRGKASGAPYDVEVAAPRADVVLYDAALHVLDHGHDVLVRRADPNRDAFLTVAICYGHGVAPGPYAVHVVQHDAEAQAAATPRRVPDAPGLPAALLAGSLLLARRARRRRASSQAQESAANP